MKVQVESEDLLFFLNLLRELRVKGTVHVPLREVKLYDKWTKWRSCERKLMREAGYSYAQGKNGRTIIIEEPSK